MRTDNFPKELLAKINGQDLIAIRLKIHTKSSHKIHKSKLLRLDFVNLNSWIAIIKTTQACQAVRCMKVTEWC